MNVRHLPLIILFTLSLAGLVVVASALADDTSPAPALSPSASPSPAPTPTAAPVVPAAQGWVDWALKWRHQAGHNARALQKVRRAFGSRWVARWPARPPRAADRDSWRLYGRVCKHLAVRYHHRYLRLRYRMAHPSPLVSFVQWKPLLRWYFGWEWPTALRVLRAESGGRPTASNGQYKGLMQMGAYWYSSVWHFNPYDAEQNIRHAKMLRDWCGWSQWSTY